MRDVKFRAWDKATRKILEVIEIDFQGMEILVIDHEEQEAREAVFGHYELMQYTGLKDENGAEIYEGDIIRITTNLQENGVDYSAQIIFKDGGFCAIDGVEDNYGVRRYRLSDFGYKLKILGNIYENNELLEELK